MSCFALLVLGISPLFILKGLCWNFCVVLEAGCFPLDRHRHSETFTRKTSVQQHRTANNKSSTESGRSHLSHHVTILSHMATKTCKLQQTVSRCHFKMEWLNIFQAGYSVCYKKGAVNVAFSSPALTYEV